MHLLIVGVKICALSIHIFFALFVANEKKRVATRIASAVELSYSDLLLTFRT